MSRQELPMICNELSPAEQEKIIRLCTTYGLNEEETRQLISDLKMGADAEDESRERPRTSDRKLSSIVSVKNQEMSFNDSDFKFESEYSFKHAPKYAGVTSQEHSFQKALVGRTKGDADQLQSLSVQNESLIREKVDLQNKVNVLLNMKSQESEIILGLKNAVCTLTSLLKDKEQAYVDLQENYDRLNCTLQERLNTQRDYYQRPQKDSLRRTELRGLREIPPVQNQPNCAFQRKPSKDFSKTKSNQNISQVTKAAEPKQQYRPSVKWSDSTNFQNSKQNKERIAPRKSNNNKLDMGKYKMFIDELKSIAAKPHRI